MYYRGRKFRSVGTVLGGTLENMLHSERERKLLKELSEAESNQQKENEELVS